MCMPIITFVHSQSGYLSDYFYHLISHIKIPQPLSVFIIPNRKMLQLFTMIMERIWSGIYHTY